MSVETDAVASDNSTEQNTIPKHMSHSKHKVKYYRTPLIIAACVFFASLLFFTGWKLLFDTSIEGTWKVNMVSADGSKTLNYDLTFSSDQTVTLHNGGVSCIGRYYFVDREDYGKVIAVYINQSGSPYISADFGYALEGNYFTGRVLRLTDYSGLFFTPDNADADQKEVEEKKSITDSIVKNDVTYYVWDFKPADVEYMLKDIPEKTVDKSLTGSWLFTDSDADYSYTITFDEDGTFEQCSYDTDIKGIYSADGSNLKLSIVTISGSPIETEVTYTIKDNKLKYNNLEFAKTNDKYAYKSQIK